MTTDPGDPILIRAVHASGHRYWAVNGLPVQPRPSDDTPLAAALRMAARIVAEEQPTTGELLTLLQDGEEETWYLVRSDGTYDEIEDPALLTNPDLLEEEEPADTLAQEHNHPAEQPTPAAPPLNVPPGELEPRTTPRATTETENTDTGGWRPQPPPAPSARQERRATRRGGSTSTTRTASRSNKAPALLIGGAAVLSLGALGYLVSQFSGADAQERSSGQAASAAPADTTVTGAPLGYAATARWVSGPLAPEVAPVITLDGEIVTVEDGQSLTNRSIQGTQTWQQLLPAAPTQLAVRTLGTTRVVVVVTATQLLTYDMTSGTQTNAIDLPSGANVNLTSQSPIVALPGTKDTVSVLRSGKLAPVKIPAGMKPLGASSDGTVLMGSGKGWVRVAPTATPGKATAWAPPTSATTKGSQPQIAAYTSTGKVITVWPIEGDGQPQVAVYDDTAKGIKLAFRTPLLQAKEGQQLRWTRSADSQWGVIGQQMIDLSTGRVEPLGPATDLQLGTGRGCATIGTQRAVFGPKVPLGVMEQGEQCPAAVLNQTALLLDKGRLKALPAKDSP